MKIILWPTHYFPNIGGIEVLTHTLAKELQSQGHEVLVFANDISENDDISEINIENVKVFLFPLTKALYRENLLLIKRILNKLNQILDEIKPDLVNVHGWFEGFSFFQNRVLADRKIPVCISVHGLLEQKHYQTVECQKLWSRAKAVSTVSKAMITSLVESNIHHKNLTVIYNGLRLPTAPIKTLSIKPPVLVMAGRLTGEKCFDIAFRALPQLIDKYPDLKLILVGGGNEINNLQALKTKLGLDKYIEMTDFVRPNRVIEYLDQASMVLVPSYYESFGLVALEAAMRGRPVIASNVYGLKEVVAHQQTGLLVEPQNPQALTQAVDYLLSNPELMQTMSIKAYHRSVDLFTIEKTTKAYLHMYQTILEST